jgi:hypothetical protein
MYCLTQVFSRYSDREDAGKTSLVRLRIGQYTVISRNLFILSLYDDVLAGVALAVHLCVPGHHWTRQREAPRVLLPRSVFRVSGSSDRPYDHWHLAETQATALSRTRVCLVKDTE